MLCLQEQVFLGESPSPGSDTRFLFPLIPVKPDDQSDIVAKYVDEGFCLTSLDASTDFPPQEQQ